jgi:hypothetical protein
MVFYGVAMACSVMLPAAAISALAFTHVAGVRCDNRSLFDQRIRSSDQLLDLFPNFFLDHNALSVRIGGRFSRFGPADRLWATSDMKQKATIAGLGHTPISECRLRRRPLILFPHLTFMWRGC